MDTFTLKSGTNKGNRRIWIEGNRLADLGLTRGRTLTRTMLDDGTMNLTTGAGANGKRHRIAGTAERPILDLCGKWVTEFMGDYTHFEVEVVPIYVDGDVDTAVMVDLYITPVHRLA